MDSESQSAQLLPQVEERIAELEQAVESFERATAEMEQRLNEVEQLEREKGLRSEFYLRPVTRALQAGSEIAAKVSAANVGLNELLARTEFAVQTSLLAIGDAPLLAGALICKKRYRVVQLLHRRPRVHLYLARRLSDSPLAGTSTQPLVAIREIILADLPTEVRQRVESATFEEFAAPLFFGSPHLPGVGDHLYVENERHYLVMQPRPARGSSPSFAVPLAELPPAQLSNAAWFDMSSTIKLGIRLCHVVARLHHMKNYLGELTPATVLVSREGHSGWEPLLLASWPPAPCFWPGDEAQESQRLFDQFFPTLGPAELSAQENAQREDDDHAFAAPELFAGRRDERSDVYALGAILYLLLTGCSPASASQRQRAEQKQERARGERHTTRQSRKARRTPAAQTRQHLALTPPRQLNGHISPLLEQILLRALALDPAQRFASELDLAEALESMHLKTGVPGKPEISTPAPASLPQLRVSRLRKLLEWLRN